MKTVTLDDARKYLSRLVEQAAKGEAFIITKDGKPMVKVMPSDAVALPGKRRIGFMAGEISAPDDFDTMMADEIEKMFYGEDEDDTVKAP